MASTQVGELFLALGMVFDSKTFNLADEAIKSMAGELKALAIAAARAVPDTQKAFDMINLKAPETAKQMHTVKDASDKVYGALKRAAIGVGLFTAARGAFGWIKGAVMDTAELGGSLNDLSKSTGQDVEVLQELGYAAKMNGSSLETVSGALADLAKRQAKAARGGKEQAAAFRAAGIAVKASNGELRPTEDVLGDIGDRLASLPEGTQRTAEAIRLLGTRGTELLPMLSEGSAGLLKWREEARKMGAVIDAENIGKLDDLGDESDRLSTAFGGLKKTVVLALVPSLLELAGSARVWILENKKLIASRITSFFEMLVSVLRVVGAVIGFVVTNWQYLAAIIGGALMASAILNAIKFFKTLAAVSKTTAIQSAIAWAIAFLPFIALAAAITFVILLLTKWRSKTLAVLRAIGDAFAALGRGIRTGLQAALRFLADLPIVKQLIWLVNKLEGFAGKFSNVKNAVFGFVDSVGNAARSAAQAPGLTSAVDEYGNPQTTTVPLKPRVSGATPGAASGSVSNTTTIGDINVNLPSGDPVANGKEVRRVVREEIGNANRSAMQNLGAP